jgi:AcrR family transcriptional regulator
MRLKDTKQKIYDVAVELFATKGYRLTTIKDIAEKVGIKPSSIYNYFNTKEEILNYIIKNFPDTYIIHIFNNKRPEELYKKGKVVLKNIANIFKLISYNNHTNLLFRIMIQELLTNDKLREVYHEELYQKSVKRLI